MYTNRQSQVAAPGAKSRRLPRTQQPSHVHDLSEVVRSVVHGNEHRPQIRLAGTVRDLRGEVHCSAGDKGGHFAAIVPELLETRAPGFVSCRRRVGRPVVVRPFEVVRVGRIAAEVEQVVLGDADVLEELPHRMRVALRAPATILGRQPFQCALERDVGLVPIQRGCDDLLPTRHG